MISVPNGPRKVALVTGATGFVGSHLIRCLLSDGWDVNAIQRGNSQSKQPHSRAIGWHFYDGRIDSLMSIVGKVRPDVVFHLASLFLSEHLPQDVDRLIVSNILYGSQLLEAMRVSGIDRMVNTGSSWQHYKSSGYNPVNLYAATKEAFETIIKYYVDAESFKAVTLKLYDTYGPADGRNKLFALLQVAARSGQELDMSAGEQLIDLVHVDDVAQAFLAASQYVIGMDGKGHECFAVSSGRPASLHEIVETFAREWGVAVNVKWDARAYRRREVMVPWRDGCPVPGWLPRIGLAEGIRQMKSELDENRP